MANVGAVQYVKHIELYVDSSSSSSQQAASVDAIASLLMKDSITLEALVREMDLYLTTTDSHIRSRGILLLGEVLGQLELKPLNGAAIRSLIEFFTERLADWKALRGALVGCLALLRRKTGVGVVTDSQAEAVAHSYMTYLQVQSFGQHDRKLCFELLECLLDRYPTAVCSLGGEIFYMICEAIDSEMDPQCLLIAFHVVELATKLFPDPSGPLESNAEELFELLGRFFPVHFTHPNGEEDVVSREALSEALRLAFASTPLFEPFAIPLLLEKLSSSLPLAKVESLKFLVSCVSKYGSDRMIKHVESLWSALKDLLYTSPQYDTCPESESESESVGGMVFKENEISVQALILLQELIQQNNDCFLDLILNDKDLTAFINSLTRSKDFDYISLHRKQLHAVSRLLSLSAKSSRPSCNKVFERFFLELMETLSVSNKNEKLNFVPLYLCVELLDAARELIVGVDEPGSIPDHERDAWCCMVRDFSEPLTRDFLFSFDTMFGESTQNIYVHFSVRGLKILATFTANFTPVSKTLYETILSKLVSLLMSDFSTTFLRETVLKAIVEIGLFVNKYQDSDKAASFESLVVEKIVAFSTSGNSSSQLQSVIDIGMSGTRNMLKVVLCLNRSLSENFSGAYINGDAGSIETVIKLLDSYSNRLFPWFDNNGGSDEIPLNFALHMLDKIESLLSVGLTVQNHELTAATIIAMKQAVRRCSVTSQSTILQKAFRLLSSNTFSKSKDSESAVTSNDDLIVSLLAAAFIAVRPQTPIPEAKTILQFFFVYLLKGHLLSAQALGSLVNKLPSRKSGTEFSQSCYLEEAIDIIFNSNAWKSCKFGDINGDDETGLSSLRLSGKTDVSVQISAISGLAWLGKGLVMRGHEKVKDITKIFLSLLVVNVNNGSSELQDCEDHGIITLIKSAADAFHVIMSDSEACLNRQFHAVIKPLYKQRYYSSIMPILSSSFLKSKAPLQRSMLSRAIAHVVSESPLPVILDDAEKLIPLLMECLSTFSKDIINNDVIYNVVLVISGILMDNNRQEDVIKNACIITDHLVLISSYQHKFLVRETAIQCLVAMSELPYAAIYPMKMKVLKAISKALDDPKRAVRKEAVKCRRAWA